MRLPADGHRRRVDVDLAAAERRADKLRAEVGELQDALAHQQASFPPSALEAARASAKEAELRAARAEQTGEALRKQVDVWKERAREATRQQRLKHMEVLADAPPPAEPREGWTEKTARLEAEVAHWRAEAAGAIAASRAFQQALWASTAFTAPEKQHLVTMLRAAARAGAGSSGEAVEKRAGGQPPGRADRAGRDR